MKVMDFRTVTEPLLIDVVRHLGPQNMLRPEKRVVYNTAELNSIPDLADTAVPDTHHLLLNHQISLREDWDEISHMVSILVIDNVGVSKPHCCIWSNRRDGDHWWNILAILLHICKPCQSFKHS